MKKQITIKFDIFRNVDNSIKVKFTVNEDNGFIPLPNISSLNTVKNQLIHNYLYIDDNNNIVIVTESLNKYVENTEYTVYDLSIIEDFEDAVNNEIFNINIQELNPGDKCLVRDYDNCDWEDAIYIGPHPEIKTRKGNYQAIVFMPNQAEDICVFNYCKPKQKTPIVFNKTIIRNNHNDNSEVILNWVQE